MQVIASLQKTCQKPHHTLLHIDSTPSLSILPSTSPKPDPLVSSNTSANLTQGSEAPDGSTVKARALLDSASSASFVSERLVKGLCLPRLHRNTTTSGVTGLTRNSLQAITNLPISSTPTGCKFNLTAIVVPRVTCDLPVHPISFSSTWNHLDDISLADPDFGCPGKVDLLLGVDIFTEALLHGRQIGPPGTPVAFETVFGWVLASPTTQPTPETYVTSHHTLATAGNDLLRKLWDIEEIRNTNPTCRQKKDPWCNTSRRVIVVLPMGDSLFRDQKGSTLHLWVSQGPMPCEYSYHLSVLCMPKTNLKPLIP